jgi:hypothetical protein
MNFFHLIEVSPGAGRQKAATPGHRLSTWRSAQAQMAAPDCLPLADSISLPSSSSMLLSMT